MSDIATLKQALQNAPTDSTVRLSWLPGGVVDVVAGDLLSAITPTVLTPTKLYSTANGVYVRSDPKLAGAIQTKLSAGETVVTVSAAAPFADGHTWAEIKVNRASVDYQGWVARDLLTDIPPAAAPTPILPANVRGVGASAGGWAPNPVELDLIRRNQVKTVLICAYQPGQAATAIPAFRNVGVQNFIIRAAAESPMQVTRWADETLPRVREYHAAIQPTADKPLLIALHNEPNLMQEGFGSLWKNGAEFAAWFEAAAALYRAALTNVKIGFPGLSPGGDITNIRESATKFWASAAPLVRSADWMGIHAYWTKPDGSDLELPTLSYKGLPVIATEVGPADGIKNTPQAALWAYRKLADANVPCVGWVLDGAGAWGNASWTANSLYLDGL